MRSTANYNFNNIYVLFQFLTSGFPTAGMMLTSPAQSTNKDRTKVFIISKFTEII